MPDTFIYFGVFLALSLGYITGYTHRYNLAKSTITRLRKHNSEMMTELRDGTTITQSQLDEFKRVVQEHLKLNEEQNNIIKYICNDSYYKRFLDGRYPSFSKLIIGLLTTHHDCHN